MAESNWRVVSVDVVGSTSVANWDRLCWLVENVVPIRITLFLARESISLGDSCLLLLVRNVILRDGYCIHLLGRASFGR